MKPYRTIAILVALAWCHTRPAAAEVFNFNNLNQPIPDGQPAGVANVQTVVSVIPHLVDLRVTLNISGNFNGDLYAYLQHGGYTSILLNRAGRTT